MKNILCKICGEHRYEKSSCVLCYKHQLEYQRKAVEKYRKTENGKNKILAYKSKPENIENDRKYRQLPDVKRKIRDLNLRRLHGITEPKYQIMFAEQQGRCAICKTEQKLLFVDHDHNTKLIRDLLCRHCNSGLGFFKDSIIVLSSAIDYLKTHGGIYDSPRCYK